MLYLNNFTPMSTLTITGIQTLLHWENPAANLDMLEEKIKIISYKTEVIILPEMFNTGFSMKPKELAETMDGETVKWMKRIAAEKKMILTGSLMIMENGNYFNRLIWMLPNGQYGYYDKRHLFAYAGEDEEFTPGTKRLIASVKGWRVHLLVCYDLRFPVWSRQAPPFREEKGPGDETPPLRKERGSGGEAISAPEYDLLIYVANWPERRNHAWKTLLQARAIENQCYVSGVNRVGYDGNNIYHSGDSMVVDPMGEILYSKAHEEDIFTLTLQKDKLEDVRTRLPFWKDGDNFIIQA
jgi:predicted amidohydrolase